MYYWLRCLNHWSNRSGHWSQSLPNYSSLLGWDHLSYWDLDIFSNNFWFIFCSNNLFILSCCYWSCVSCWSSISGWSCVSLWSCISCWSSSIIGTVIISGCWCGLYSSISVICCSVFCCGWKRGRFYWDCWCGVSVSIILDLRCVICCGICLIGWLRW